MNDALRNRLTFGPMMLAGLLGLLWLDWKIEQATAGWVPADPAHNIASHGLAGVGVFILLMVILPIATVELATLFTAKHMQPYKFLASLGSGSLVLHAFLTQFPWFKGIAASTLVFIIICPMIIAAIRRAAQRISQEAITHMAGTVLAMLYLGGLGWFLLALRVKHSVGHFQGSTAAVVMILLVVKFTDIGAFFGGKALGRHKLIPWLSPGKTWEGLICGLATAALVGLACYKLWPSALGTIDPGKALIFGIVIGGIGQIGDLMESLMKRDAEVKDSGHLIPGFGGLLDVIDSPLLAAPAAYLLFSLM